MDTFSIGQNDRLLLIEGLLLGQYYSHISLGIILPCGSFHPTNKKQVACGPVGDVTPHHINLNNAQYW